MKIAIISLAVLATSFSLTTGAAQTATSSVLENSIRHGDKNILGACQFFIDNLLGGRLSTYSDSNPPTAIYHLPAIKQKGQGVSRSFTLNCSEADDRNVGIALGAKRINDNWFQYDPSVNGSGLIPFEKNARPQTVTFKEANWKGIGLTSDATTGDEEKRARFFNFCLIHKKQALCGNTPVEWLADPKHNDLSRIKKILESVIFVDD